MNLYGQRFERSKDGTASIQNLYIENRWECFVLEDQVREPSDRPLDTRELANWVLGWKVKGKTAIPSGTYEIRWTQSPKYSKRAGKPVSTLEIMDVPGFSGVRYHPGNIPDHTKACQLPGRLHSPGAASVQESTLALRALEAKLCPVLERGEKVWITITNDFDSFFAPGQPSRG